MGGVDKSDERTEASSTCGIGLRIALEVTGWT